MLHSKGPSAVERQQLQELNNRLTQYLLRTQQLERENARLVAQVSTMRQERAAQYVDEMRDLRRRLEQLRFEKSQAEMEREGLRRELQRVQSACTDQSEVQRNVSGQLRGQGKGLRLSHRTNSELQRRLLQLQGEYTSMEDAHRRCIQDAWHHLDVEVTVNISKNYRGAPGDFKGEVQECVRSKFEGWIKNFDMYQRRMNELDQGLEEDQALRSVLQAEKITYASLIEQLNTEAEKQMLLEEQLMAMQEKSQRDLVEYQGIIAELQQERDLIADILAEKVEEHRHLLRNKMDLGMEVAAYRALLEGDRVRLHDSQSTVIQHQRERLDMKIPAKPDPRSPVLTTRNQMRFTEPARSLTRCHVLHPSPVQSKHPSTNTFPVSTGRRSYHQSPDSRKDMISFMKARAAASSPNPMTITTAATAKNTPTDVSQSVQLTSDEAVKPKQDFRECTQSGAIPFSQAETESVEVVSPPIMGLNMKITAETSKPIPEDSNYLGKKPQLGEDAVNTHIELESREEEEVLDVGKESAQNRLRSGGVKILPLEGTEDMAARSITVYPSSQLQGTENRKKNVEVGEDFVDSRCVGGRAKQRSRSSSKEPASKYFQTEEASYDTHMQTGNDDIHIYYSPETDPSKIESLYVQDVSGEGEFPYIFLDDESAEYFVSTPDDSLSLTEDGEGFTAYDQYGAKDDLPNVRDERDESDCDEYKFMSSFTESSPECVIEEEVRVSPVVQKSVLEILREGSLKPKEQLKGALEKLQSSLTGPLKEELEFLTKVSAEHPENVAVNIRTLEQSGDDKTMTIVAELNISQTLEDPSLLDEDDDLSEEQINAALTMFHQRI